MKNSLLTILKARGVNAFLTTVAPGGKVLDVGCGNDSPWRFKSQRPDIHYIGLDIGDYNQSSKSSAAADTYIVVKPELFAREIEKLAGTLDAVVSSHNLEHCNDPAAVLQAMAQSLKPGGKLYLAFPCEESVRFPKRVGTLNFHDDPTHRNVPGLGKTRSSLERQGMQVDFSAKRYRPSVLWLCGLLLEPWSAVSRKLMPYGTTWALYGFESVIWATRSHVGTAAHDRRLP